MSVASCDSFLVVSPNASPQKIGAATNNSRFALIVFNDIDQKLTTIYPWQDDEGAILRTPNAKSKYNCFELPTHPGELTYISHILE